MAAHGHAAVLVPGLTLLERAELNRTARAEGLTTAEYLRRLIRSAISSDGVTQRRPESVTSRIQRVWILPGDPRFRALAEAERADGGPSGAIGAEGGDTGVAPLADGAATPTRPSSGPSSPSAGPEEG